MELELGVSLRPLGPLAKAACTPGLVADGERRFVVDEVGPSVICLEGLMAEYGDGFERFCSAVVISKKERAGEGEAEGRSGWKWSFKTEEKTPRNS